jgi:GH24 family phage-related lysozyme (muramidase)
MTTSEACIALIKEYEGFSSRVYWDSGSAYIGYGTVCKSADYPDGISQETGDALLRQALAVKRKKSTVFWQNTISA